MRETETETKTERQTDREKSKRERARGEKDATDKGSNLRIPSRELLAKSTTPEVGRVTTPTRPLPIPGEKKDRKRNEIIA